ncbi:hypothetical protein D9613_011258 [Agrocybe pediades]|uniref:DUF6534 domain-containing protein n=1 Tax=Agrocybe pediades TaxID=84607 RepID=A0A8H4QRQ8_9AGAR|nr:hypothetical protein D9613_011258 [Agrocybe pediades]
MPSRINPADFFVQADANLGAVEVATFLSLILYGVSLSQGYTYFRRFEGDRFRLKFMVSMLLCLETFHSFTAGMAIYYDTVTRWKTAEANSYPISTNVVLETLITLLVQCFFCFRIYRLSGRFSVSILCFVLALVRFIGGVAMSVENYKDVPNKPNNGVATVARFSWMITAALACGSGADILIAISMIYYLRKMASPANLQSTTDILNRLIRFALQTGLITSMTSLAVIACFQAMSNMIWFGLYIILAKLYSNSLLVSLNARPATEIPSTLPKNLASELIFHAGAAPVSVFSIQMSRQDHTSDWTRSLSSPSKENAFGPENV